MLHIKFRRHVASIISILTQCFSLHVAHALFCRRLVFGAQLFKAGTFIWRQRVNTASRVKLGEEILELGQLIAVRGDLLKSPLALSCEKCG